MLEFLYTSDYDEATKPAITQVNEDNQTIDVPVDADDYECLACDIHMYAIADKYDIQELKTLAKSKFQSSVSGRWPIAFFPALVQEILVSTPSTDSGLRDIVTKICAEHITELLDGDNREEDSQDIGNNTAIDTPKQPNFSQTLATESTFTSTILAKVVRNSSKKAIEADAAYARLSQEFVTYKEKAIKETDGLKAKLQQSRRELSDCKDVMRAAGRQPVCCEGQGFLPSFSPGNSLSPPRLRLKCAACRKVYN